MTVRNLGPTGHSENVFCRPEAICLRHSNRKPDEAEEKVEHHYEDRKAEYKTESLGRKVVDCDRDNEKTFRNCPDESAPFNVVIGNPSWEIDLPDGKLRNNVVRRCLRCRL